MKPSPATLPTEPARTVALPANRYLAFASIALLGALLDLWTKHQVFLWRGIPQLDHEWWIVENYFGVETAMNPGALFGLGAGWSMFFAALSIVAVVGILAWLFYAKAASDLWLTLILACITAGILGNLYDRLGLGFTDSMREQYVAAGYPPDYIARQEHSVRDWILLRWRTKQRTWPNFNIADMLLVGGATALVIRSFQTPDGAKSSEGGSQNSSVGSRHP